tara:strand:+ start:613 stop:1728 length:1116 start_codon:yes stop_codon:yes gene_type:complete
MIIKKNNLFGKPKRVLNFSSGPAILPEPVLKKASAEMLDWHGKGISVMEMSHRSDNFMQIYHETKKNFRKILSIPKNFSLFFFQGGASVMNSIIPMNLLNKKLSADYVKTGEWSKRSIMEAKKYCNVKIVATSEDKNFTYIPDQSSWKLNKNSAFVHICSNETIGGVEFHWNPDTGNIPLVSDMSSHLLTKNLDFTCYDVIYAGAQKNMGIPGLTFVIVRNDLIKSALPITPSIFNLEKQYKNNSMLNTPPTYNIYIAGLIFEWLIEIGGIEIVEKMNIKKSSLLYNYIDSTDFYNNFVNKKDRSRVNIPFFLKDPNLENKFLTMAEKEGFLHLNGHRSVGGLRASIYNAMPYEGVNKLVNFLKDFEKRFG